MTGDSAQSVQVDKLALEVEHLSRQNEKLSIEIQTLKATSPTNPWEGRLSRFMPVFTALIAAGGLWFGIVQFFRAESATLAQRKEADKTLRLDLQRETAKPLWDKRLELYIEASEVAATIATTKDEESRNKAEERFWILYWGPLAATEDIVIREPPDVETIEAKMVTFGKHVTKKSEDRDRQQMEQDSLSLAHAIRKALQPGFRAAMETQPAESERDAAK